MFFRSDFNNAIFKAIFSDNKNFTNICYWRAAFINNTDFISTWSIWVKIISSTSKLKNIIYKPVNQFLLRSKKIIFCTRLLDDFYIEFTIILKTVFSDNKSFTKVCCWWAAFINNTDFISTRISGVKIISKTSELIFIIYKPVKQFFPCGKKLIC